MVTKIGFANFWVFFKINFEVFKVFFVGCGNDKGFVGFKVCNVHVDARGFGEFLSELKGSENSGVSAFGFGHDSQNVVEHLKSGGHLCGVGTKVGGIKRFTLL